MKFHYHILYFSPNLDGQIFETVFANFWQKFQPIVTQHIDTVGFFTETERLMLTLVCPPEKAEYLLQQVQEIRNDENLLLDLLAVEDESLLSRVLARRVSSELPVGIPEMRCNESF